MGKSKGKTHSRIKGKAGTGQKGRSHLPLFAAALYLAVLLFFFIDAVRSVNFGYTFPFIGLGGVFKHHYANISGLRISLYWAAHAIGIFGMIILCLLRRKRFGISAGFAVVTALLLAVLGYIGAKLLYVLENWSSVMERGLSLNGVSFFGTVFFMPLVLPLVAKLCKKPAGAYLDYCTPSGLLMLICIRTGCFLNGCCHGLTLKLNGNDVVLPSQLLECVLDLILLEILFAKEKKLPGGKLYFLFMTGYGLLRFAVEFTRATPKALLGLSNGQWFSLISMVVGAAALLIRRKKPQAVR